MRRLLTVFTIVVLTTLCADPGLAQNGSGRPIITPENAPQIVQLERLGEGKLDSDVGWPPIVVGKKIAWSPDGVWLAVAGSLGARLYRADALDTPVHFLDPDEWVSDVVFSPDSSILATATCSTTYLWDVQTGAQINATLDGTVAAFSPDGKLLALGSYRSEMAEVWAEVRLIDRATWTELAVMDSERFAQIADITFSSDGTLLAVTWTNISLDGCYEDMRQGLQVWRVADALAQGVMDWRGRLYDGTASAIAFSPDGRRLASGGAYPGDGLVFRDAQTGEIQTVVVDRGWVHDMAFSPDGSLFVAAVFVEAETVYEHTLRVFDAETGAELDTLSTEPVYSLAFNPDGSALAAVGRDRVTIWRPEESGWVQSGGIASLEKIELSPDATQLALYSETTLAIQDIKTGTRQDLLQGEAAQIKSVLFSRDGGSLLSISENGAAQVWDTQTGALVSTLNQRFPARAEFVFSPNGRLIASYDMSDQDTPPLLQLWETLTGQKRTEFELPSHSGSVEFSPDGRLLAAICFSYDPESALYIWDVENGDTADDFPASFSSYPFSPDATKLVYETALDSVRVRDISTGSDTLLFEVDTLEFFSSAAFSPDGTRLAVATSAWQGCGPGEANTLHVWDVSGPPDSYFEIASVEITHVNDLAYNPESTVLAAATEYGIVLVDARDGTTLTRLLAGEYPAYQVRFAPDGRTLISNGPDGAIRVWGVP